MESSLIQVQMYPALISEQNWYPGVQLPGLLSRKPLGELGLARAYSVIRSTESWCLGESLRPRVGMRWIHLARITQPCVLVMARNEEIRLRSSHPASCWSISVPRRWLWTGSLEPNIVPGWDLSDGGSVGSDGSCSVASYPSVVKNIKGLDSGTCIFAGESGVFHFYFWIFILCFMNSAIKSRSVFSPWLPLLMDVDLFQRNNIWVIHAVNSHQDWRNTPWAF